MKIRVYEDRGGVGSSRTISLSESEVIEALENYFIKEAYASEEELCRDESYIEEITL